MDQSQGYIDVQAADGRVIPLTVETHTIIPAPRLAANITENTKRDIPRFVDRACLEGLKSEPLAIVACGPSLKNTLDRLRDFKHTLVCGSAHDYVVRAGIIPTYAIVADGGIEDKQNLSLPQKETTYLIASQCDPSLFDHLQDYRVQMWHWSGQAATGEDEAKLLGGEAAIAWGTTVTLTAIHLALLLGHRHIHFFGFDSAYADYGLSHHVCEVAGWKPYDKVPARIGERLFISDVGLLHQAECFFKLLEWWGAWMHVTIHGDGLIAECVRQGEPGLEQYVSLA